MNGTSLQITLREMQGLCKSRRFWTGLVAVVFILAVAGPFGTSQELDFAERLVYWAVSSTLTFFTGLGVSILVGVSLHTIGLPLWPSRIVGGCCASLPVAIIVWTINQFGFDIDMGGWSVFLYVWFSCLIISIAINVLYQLARNPEVHDIGQPLFLDRLPRHLGKKLLHLSSQDHYVEAVTDLGSELILMRFSDALRELDSAKGMQIHRAHWIAFNAIKRPIKQDGKLLIEMADGIRFPVSRTYLKAVKQALNLK